jgi:hypothetical protein
MGRLKIKVVVSKCRRCGKKLATTNRSIWGNDAAKKKYELICKDCLTDEEYNDMFANQMNHIRNHFCR